MQEPGHAGARGAGCSQDCPQGCACYHGPGGGTEGTQESPGGARGAHRPVRGGAGCPYSGDASGQNPAPGTEHGVEARGQGGGFHGGGRCGTGGLSIAGAGCWVRKWVQEQGGSTGAGSWGRALGAGAVCWVWVPGQGAGSGCRELGQGAGCRGRELGKGVRVGHSGVVQGWGTGCWGRELGAGPGCCGRVQRQGAGADSC